MPKKQFVLACCQMVAKQLDTIMDMGKSLQGPEGYLCALGLVAQLLMIYEEFVGKETKTQIQCYIDNKTNLKCFQIPPLSLL